MVIREYINYKYEVVEADNDIQIESQKKYSVDKIREKGLTSEYAPWTSEEVDKLKKEFAAGTPIKELSKIHGRTKGAIKSKLKKRKSDIAN
jgi:ATP-dependent DNA helicase RecQ